LLGQVPFRRGSPPGLGRVHGPVPGGSHPRPVFHGPYVAFLLGRRVPRPRLADIRSRNRRFAPGIPHALCQPTGDDSQAQRRRPVPQPVQRRRDRRLRRPAPDAGPRITAPFGPVASPLDSGGFFLHHGGDFRLKTPFSPPSAKTGNAGKIVPQLPSTVPDLLFAVCGVLVVGLSLAVVVARNPVRATLLLILSLFRVALIYILVQATCA